MFSIYATAVLSLDTEECLAMFSLPKTDLLSRYQFACQQALLNCGFLQRSDRDCLTALFLYMASISLVSFVVANGSRFRSHLPQMPEHCVLYPVLQCV